MSTAQAKKLFLDPVEEKESMKQRITDVVNEQFKSAGKEQIADIVDKRYDELLAHASVTQHVPTLAEGRAKSELRQKTGRG